MAIRLISDLHLDETRPGITRAFLHYLETLPDDTEALYMLGDIFEIWIGDDDDAHYLNEIKQAIRQLNTRNIAVFIMHGNRDFLLAEQFCQDCQCTLLEEPYRLDYLSTSYLLMHGDSLCIDDLDYMEFKNNIRKPESIAFLLSKPLLERREIAKGLRAQSKSMNSNKAQDIMDVNTDEVLRVLNEHNIKHLIHGHTHRPAIHKLDNGQQRTVLGDWTEKAWEIVIDENGLQLNEFSTEE